MQKVISFKNFVFPREHNLRGNMLPPSRIEDYSIEPAVKLKRGRHWRKCGRFLGTLLLALFVSVPATLLAMEYGETGPYSVVSQTLINPLSGGEITVFFPQKAQKPLPVMFFSHGYGGNYWRAYGSLMTHVASRGVAVVFSPYPSDIPWTEQYNIMWSGFEQAANVFELDFDFQRVGFFGHSWGAGAVPNMALRGVDRGWGQKGMLMFIMAPGPSYGVTDRDLKSLSSACLIVQSFENDTVVPESLAKVTYETIGVPGDDKAYYFISGGDHSEPSERSVNDYDKLAIWPPIDALMDVAFNMGDPYGGRIFALEGKGEHYNTTILTGSTEPPDEEEPRWSIWKRFRNR